jgi:hypothetical protein
MAIYRVLAYHIHVFVTIINVGSSIHDNYQPGNEVVKLQYIDPQVTNTSQEFLQTHHTMFNFKSHLQFKVNNKQLQGTILTAFFRDFGLSRDV